MISIQQHLVKAEKSTFDKLLLNALRELKCTLFGNLFQALTTLSQKKFDCTPLVDLLKSLQPGNTNSILHEKVMTVDINKPKDILQHQIRSLRSCLNSRLSFKRFKRTSQEQLRKPDILVKHFWTQCLVFKETGASHSHENVKDFKAVSKTWSNKMLD